MVLLSAMDAPLRARWGFSLVELLVALRLRLLLGEVLMRCGPAFCLGREPSAGAALNRGCGRIVRPPGAEPGGWRL